MLLTHWHAACQKIEAHGVRILTDPWFGYGDGDGGGNYDGSWGPSVPLPTLPDLLTLIGQVDYIFLSHLHPDHYAPIFLKVLLSHHLRSGWEPPRLLISDEPLLHRALQQNLPSASVGDALIVPPHDTVLLKNAVEVHIFRHPTDVIDSAMVVLSDRIALAHVNDCQYHPTLVAQITAAMGTRVKAACLPYLGAGEFPQTYRMTDPEAEARRAQKRQRFKGQFCKYVDDLNVTWAFPIAGESHYIGPLAALNPLRGLPSLEEAALWRLQGKALAFGETWDLDRGQRVAGTPPAWTPNTQPPPFTGYRYEQDFCGLPARRIERLLPGLAVKAAHNLLARQTIKTPYWYAIGTERRCHAAVDLSGRWGVRPGMAWERVAKELGEPREEVQVDARYLYGLLTGLYAWNTAMGGGHLRCRRVPLDDYRPEIYFGALNHLHV